MKKKKILILLISFFIVFSFIPSGNAQKVAATESNSATKDTFVDLNNPLSNYGGKDWLIFGFYIWDYREAYIGFDTSSPPSGWTKAEIEINMYFISETTQLTVSEITENWGELTITWYDKPAHRDVITTLTVAEGDTYTIDVTNFISGNSLSICINASSYLTRGYVQATSREGSVSRRPTLIWTYNIFLDEEGELIPGYNPLIISGIMLGIGILLTKKKLRKL